VLVRGDHELPKVVHGHWTSVNEEVANIPSAARETCQSCIESRFLTAARAGRPVLPEANSQRHASRRWLVVDGKGHGLTCDCREVGANHAVIAAGVKH